MDLDEKAAIVAQADVTEPLVWDRSPEPFKERYRRIVTESPLLALILARYRAIEEAATAYRRAEQDGTPRLWRGKDLHELGLALDETVEASVHSARGETVDATA